MDGLILPCSRRKRDPRSLPSHIYDNDGTVIAPAGAVYDGPLARIARKHAPYRDLDIWFLSARFGLIRASYPIPLYDQKMTAQQSTDIEWIGRRITLPWLRIGAGRYENVYTCLSRRYESALNAGLEPLGITPASIVRRRGQGYMFQALKAFCHERAS